MTIGVIKYQPQIVTIGAVTAGSSNHYNIEVVQLSKVRNETVKHQIAVLVEYLPRENAFEISAIGLAKTRKGSVSKRL